PLYALGTDLTQSVRLGVFVLVSFLISALTARSQRLRERLQQQGRRKDRFLAMLAHELLNPLSASLNALLILRLRDADAQAVQQAQDIVERQLRHMARLIDDVLDVSRISAGKIRLRKERTDLAGAVARAVEAVRP